jgi:hypothetical protein
MPTPPPSSLPPPPSLQMYSQPIYQAIEAGLRSKWPHLLARRSKRMPVRMVYRSINVVVGGAALFLMAAPDDVASSGRVTTPPCAQLPQRSLPHWCVNCRSSLASPWACHFSQP